MKLKRYARLGWMLMKVRMNRGMMYSFNFWTAFITDLSLFVLHVNFSFRIPGVVFRGMWKLLFFVFLPYGLMATIPTQFLTDVMDGRYWVLTLAVSAAFWSLCILMWKRGLRRYTSASS